MEFYNRLTHKLCTKCNRIKPLSLFRKKGHEPGRKPRLCSWCKKCSNKIKAEYYRKRYENDSELRERRSEFIRKAKNRFSKSVKDAKKRNLSWELTFDEWISIVIDKNCYYCSGILSETGSGLDRKK